MLVRTETPADREAVADLHRRAFGHDGEKVAALVERLRDLLKTPPGASLVAEEDDRVVGHVLLTRSLLDAPPRLVEVAVLSPLGVLPERQRRRVGAALVTAGIAEMEHQGVPLVFLEGSPDYYPKLGFVAAGGLGFRKPSLRIPDAAFQVVALSAFAAWMTGTLVYDQVFWEFDAVGLREGDPRLD